jgi:hypothetical protein
MFKLLFRLFLLALLVYIISNFPGLITTFIKIFQVAGGYILAGISTQPLLFAIGFVVLYGLQAAKTSKS